jgi:hypothetical protein
MRIGISGTHGTGKTTLADALSERLPGHVTADEPYYLLEEEGYEFGFPPSPEDYRALLARWTQRSPGPPGHPVIMARPTRRSSTRTPSTAAASPSATSSSWRRIGRSGGSTK